MSLDIDKILERPKEEIEQKDLERFQELGIISNNLKHWEVSGQTIGDCSINKCKYDEEIFFVFSNFIFNSKLELKNHINLEKYLQSDELNLILYNCYYIEDQEAIKYLERLKRKVIIVRSKLPNISSCKFENEVFLRNINNNNAFSGCEFAKEVCVDGYAFFRACTFNGDFISKNAEQNISFVSSIFNKSFELVTKNELGEVKFEATHFKQKFTMNIRKFNVLDFTGAKFDCELALHAKQFDGININFTKTMFKQKVSFHRSIINCEVLFEEACFEGDLIFTEAKFNDVVNLDKAKFKGEAQFSGTKFYRAILTEINFENKADFSNAVFNDKAYFTNATFAKEVKFNNILFKNNAYFRNTVFKDFVDFNETNFEKNANFYNADFKKPVNFSSIIFNGALNFVNAKTDFTYEELKKFIKAKSVSNESINNIDKCISITNDFRDGFRLIKYALNNKGNALDASLFHRLELYCKELELEFSLENTKTKNSENSKEVKSTDETKGAPKNKNLIEIFLDLITLKLYRNTSDHHTNLLRIINFIVLTIAVYGFAIFMYEKIILTCLISLPYDFVYSILLVVLCAILGVAYNRIPKYNIAWVYILLVGLIMLIIISAIITYMHAKYTAYIALFITLYLAIYFIAVIASRCNWIYLIYYSLFIAIFFIKPFLIAPFISIFTSEQAIESKFKKYTIRYNENGLDDMLLDANLTNTKKDNKLDFIVENRKTILDELDDDKKLLISFKENFKKLTDYNDDSKNTQDTSKKSYAEALNALKYDEIMQSTQKSANLLYGFIMLLVIYSLTKTARKNSVVPS